MSLKMNVIDKTHKFSTPSHAGALEHNTSKVPAECFSPPLTDRSMDWAINVSTGEAAWHSPSASN